MENGFIFRVEDKATTNSVALVRELTIPNERSQLIGEVNVNISG
jgi:hypothetical protein